MAKATTAEKFIGKLLLSSGSMFTWRGTGKDLVMLSIPQTSDLHRICLYICNLFRIFFSNVLSTACIRFLWCFTIRGLAYGGITVLIPSYGRKLFQPKKVLLLLNNVRTIKKKKQQHTAFVSPMILLLCRWSFSVGEDLSNHSETPTWQRGQHQQRLVRRNF